MFQNNHNVLNKYSKLQRGITLQLKRVEIISYEKVITKLLFSLHKQSSVCDNYGKMW